MLYVCSLYCFVWLFLSTDCIGLFSSSFQRRDLVFLSTVYCAIKEVLLLLFGTSNLHKIGDRFVVLL